MGLFLPEDQIYEPFGQSPISLLEAEERPRTGRREAEQNCRNKGMSFCFD